MTVVSLQDAERQLTRLLEEVEQGEEVLISREGKPVAQLVAVGNKPSRRKLGRDRGLFEVPDDFNDPLPEDILKSFEG